MKNRSNPVLFSLLIVLLASCRNQPPVCIITNPSDSTSIRKSEQMVIFADITDLDSKILSVSFYLDGIKVGKDRKFPYSLNINTEKLSSGYHTISVISLDYFLKKSECQSVFYLSDFDLTRVKEGTFMMGNASGSFEEKPEHQVNISGFYLSRFEITNAEYCRFLNDHAIDSSLVFQGHQLYFKHLPGSFIQWNGNYFEVEVGYEAYPVVNVSWYGATSYCQWAGGRLPTEAEWEYAARGGSFSETSLYAGSNSADSAGWCWENSNQSLLKIDGERGFSKVGEKISNRLGLYDMSGNVWEWCADWYDSGYYRNSPGINPNGPDSGETKAIRGGGWLFSCDVMTVSNRLSRNPEDGYPYLGFRLCIPF